MSTATQSTSSSSSKSFQAVLTPLMIDFVKAIVKNFSGNFIQIISQHSKCKLTVDEMSEIWDTVASDCSVKNIISRKRTTSEKENKEVTGSCPYEQIKDHKDGKYKKGDPCNTDLYGTAFCSKHKKTSQANPKDKVLCKKKFEQVSSKGNDSCQKNAAEGKEGYCLTHYKKEMEKKTEEGDQASDAEAKTDKTVKAESKKSGTKKPAAKKPAAKKSGDKKPAKSSKKSIPKATESDSESEGESGDESNKESGDEAEEKKGTNEIEYVEEDGRFVHKIGTITYVLNDEKTMVVGKLNKEGSVVKIGKIDGVNLRKANLPTP